MSCTFRAGDESRGLAFVIQNYGALSVGSMKDHEIGHHFPRSISIVLDWEDLESGVSVWIRKSSEEKRNPQQEEEEGDDNNTSSKTLCQVRTGGEDNSVVHRGNCVCS